MIKNKITPYNDKSNILKKNDDCGNGIQRIDEHTLLLPTSTKNNTEYYHHLTDIKEAESYSTHLYWLISSTAAMVFALLLINIGRMITVSMVGHLGTKELAGMSLAQMLEDCPFFCISVGMSITLDTLCGQSWTSSKDKTVIGLYLQRALCVYATIFFSVAIFCGMGLSLLKGTELVDSDVLYYTTAYVPFMILGCFATGISLMVLSYLRAQGIMRVAIYGTLVSFPVSVMGNYALVAGHPFSFGVAGASLAGALYTMTVCGFNIGYIYWVAGSEGWGGWSRDCLHNWLPTVRLWVPSTFLVLVEIAVPRLCSLAAAQFGSDALSAYFIMLNTCVLGTVFSVSLKQIMVTRVGNLLGKGALTDTKRAIIVSNYFALGTGVTIAVILFASRSAYPYIFTNDEKTARIVSESLPLLAFILVISNVRYNLVGVAYGVGHQRQTAWITIISYIFISLPSCYFFAFPLGWSVYGLWVGNIAAELSGLVLLFIHLNSLHWSEEAHYIMNQALKEEK